MKNYLIPFAAIALLFTSCSSDDDNIQPTPIPANYQKGILVTNEGPFNNGSGSITYISEDFSVVENNVYKNVNGSDLGNVVQSTGFADNDAFIVASNSHKIVIVDRYSFIKKDSMISGFENPRYFASNGQNKGYVTNWGDPMDDTDDYVAVIDLATNAITANIPVSFGPEKILNYGDKLYVAHKGGYGFNNRISVLSGNSVVSTIVVGDIPDAMSVVGNYLYVMGAGKPDYSGEETAGSITKIDLTSDEVVDTYFFELGDYPTGLTVDGSKLIYNLNGKVYSTDLNSIELPGTPIIDGYFYTIEARNGMLYATDPGDFASRGRLYVYDLSTNQQVQNIQTGIIPGGIYFND